jgi:hypothetical protein
MKKFYIVRELAIVKNHLYQIISDPRFYDIKEPALTKLRYVYNKVSSLYDALTGVED